MDTKLLHLSQVPISTGLPESLDDPIKPDLFRGFHKGRLGAQASVTQFGVNHVTLWSPAPSPRCATGTRPRTSSSTSLAASYRSWTTTASTR